MTIDLRYLTYSARLQFAWKFCVSGLRVPHMFLKFRFRPTTVNDFLLRLSLDESEPGTGAYVLPFASEKEVYEQFAPLEAHVNRIKQLALQLVQTMAVEQEKGVGAAHRAFKKIFPQDQSE